MGMDIGASTQKKGQAHPEMNVTPLVDVVLVLLIIFMVITPMMNANFWIHIPRKNTQEQPELLTPPDPNTLPIVVSVTEEGQIRINRDLVPDADFTARLRRVLAARADRKIFFDASDQAPYARAVEVLDMARGGGASHIAVMTESIP